MTSKTSERLRAEIENALGAARIPGCSIALVDRTGLRWSAGFGFADVRREECAHAQTVYHLFSGTKLFTATAVVQLAERGRLSLGDALTKHLPEFALPGLTLTHLLSHTSGLKDSLRSFLAVTFPPDSLPSSSEALARYQLASAAPPGSKVAYRNVNYALLGEVVTRASGTEFTTYVEREILRPLGMKAAFAVDDSMRDSMARGYIGQWDPMRLVVGLLLPNTRGRLYGETVGGLVELEEFNLATAAIGGLIGTVEDFGLFLRAHLDAGANVISPDSTRAMQRQVASGAAGIESRVGVGLGWKIGRVDGRTFLNHEGGGAGFTSELRLYPEAGLGVALAMNAMRMPATMKLAHRLCEAVYTHRQEVTT
ncbi:MAG: serine hydrolase domain-containing protein [Longimicrobiales bacterium]